jgi:hypothetical protein
MERFHPSGMISEAMVYTMMGLVGAVAVLLLLCVFYLRAIANRLGRTDQSSGHSRSSSSDAKNSPPLDFSSRESRSGAFVRFMTDHPELAELTKSEQFAAFRNWRKEQGLNWEGR